MNFELTAEQRLVQATAHDWFAKHFQPSDMRRLLDGGTGAANAGALTETGYLGSLVDVQLQGGGLSLLELALVCEQAGRVLADAPLVATAAHAVGVLAHGGAATNATLAMIAAGGVAAVMHTAEGDFDRATKTLTAHCRPAIGAELASTLVVVHEDEADAWVVLVASDARGVVRSAPPAIDPTRRIASVHLDRTPATLVTEGESARLSIESGYRKAIVALAAEDLGAAAACMESAITYAKERRAFGRPIGSFQAIKHLCVDAYIAVEQLRTLVWYAAWCDEGEPAAFGMAASAARAYAADTLAQCAQTLIQVHGGVGVTWEHDAHLYWRRAQVDRVVLGDSAHHRELVACAALDLAVTHP
jgi:alkylation response protein AidB-like acyl-CoA dehydrogenase